jgi:hypothetical protein
MPFELVPVQLPELTDYLTHIVEQSVILFPNQHDFFVNLLNTGCRYSDLADISNYQILANSDVLIHAPKNDNYYTFTKSELTPSLYTAIEQNNTDYYSFSYYLLERWFNRFASGIKYYSRSKPLSLHLFRHHKAKMLKSQGYTDLQIKEALAERKLSSAENYIYSVLRKEVLIT